MYVGSSGTRELARSISKENIGIKPATGEPINEKSKTQSGDGLDFGESKPVTVSRQAILPLAPLQSVTLYDKRNIAEFLTFVEAIALMLASRDMHQAIKADPWLRLDEMSALFDRLGCIQLARTIQSIDAEISELQLQLGPSTMMTGTQPDAAKPSITFAGHSFRLPRSLATKALQSKEKSRQAELRERESEKAALKAQLAKSMQALEPDIEGVVFHFASERLKGPRPVKGPDAAAQAISPPDKTGRKFHKAIDKGNVDKGDVELLRAGLREFLSLPARLMPNARKVAWLREPQGMCTLEFFGQYPCGRLSRREQGQYQAIMAYVDEIVSSQYLSPSEKRQVCVRLELSRLDQSGVEKLVELDVVRHAVSHNNPAVAASILLGIHDSSAEPELKQYLLAAVAASWDGGLAKCVDEVSALLGPYEKRALNWIKGLIARLESMKPALPVTGETKS